jgi:hypothetical protein
LFSFIFVDQYNQKRKIVIDIKSYQNQNYTLLKEKYSSTRLFIDPEFPANLHSISHTGNLLKNKAGESILKYIEWRRPHVRKCLF